MWARRDKDMTVYTHDTIFFGKILANEYLQVIFKETKYDKPTFEAVIIT